MLLSIACILCFGMGSGSGREPAFDAFTVFEACCYSIETIEEFRDTEEILLDYLRELELIDGKKVQN